MNDTCVSAGRVIQDDGETGIAAWHTLGIGFVGEGKHCCQRRGKKYWGLGMLVGTR